MTNWPEVVQYFELMRQLRKSGQYPAITEGILNLVVALQKWCDAQGIEVKHSFTALMLSVPSSKHVYIKAETPNQYNILLDYESEEKFGQEVSATLEQVVPILQAYIDRVTTPKK